MRMSRAMPLRSAVLVSGRGLRLYNEFGNTGKEFTLDVRIRIEIQSMVASGIPSDVATGWVIRALKDFSNNQ
jgi:hypothetical protein